MGGSKVAEVVGFSELFPSSPRGKFVDQSSYKEERLFAAILDLILGIQEH